jgi:hypothetical protein
VPTRTTPRAATRTISAPRRVRRHRLCESAAVVSGAEQPRGPAGLRRGGRPRPQRRRPRLDTLIPDSPNQPHDMHTVIESVVDAAQRGGCCEAGDQREPGPSGGLDAGRTHQRRHRDRAARRGLPGAVETAPPGRLMLGDDDDAVRGRIGGPLGGHCVRRSGLVEHCELGPPRPWLDERSSQLVFRQRRSVEVRVRAGVGVIGSHPVTLRRCARWLPDPPAAADA